MSSPATTIEPPRLRRSLTLWDLILYGVIVIQPVAPMSVFGVLSNAGRGHVVTMILIAMVAMLFTAISYGRMARVYPSAGSAFTYVGQEINPALGYVTGWSMMMDYMLNPMICTIWCSKARPICSRHPVSDSVSRTSVASYFRGSCSRSLNLRGVKTSARINQTLCAIMGAGDSCFFLVTIRYIFHPAAGSEAFFLRPFYDPGDFHHQRRVSWHFDRRAHLYRV